VSDFESLTRLQWLDLAREYYEHLARVMDGLAPAEWDRVTPYFGWRARDVLAHMTSVMPVNFRQVLDRAMLGNPGPPLEFDTFNRNAREVARRRDRPVTDVIAEFRSELARLLATYRNMSDADWQRPAWFFVGPVRVRTLFLVQFADNVFHERDLLVVNGKWPGLDAHFAAPLLDWFIREFRAATFRPERAAGLRATVRYRVGGAAGGEWTMRIGDGRCTVERGAGGTADVEMRADGEDLVVGALGRASPLVGRFARLLTVFRNSHGAEDTVAGVTGRASMLGAVLRGRVRVSGNRALAARVNRSFWHFWQRSAMTRANIAAGGVTPL